MTTVDSVNAQLTADASDFTAGMRSALASLNNLKAQAAATQNALQSMQATFNSARSASAGLAGGAGSATAALRQTSTAARGAQQATSGLGSAVQGVAGSVVVMAAGFAAFQAVRSLVSAAGDAVFGLNARLEQSKIGWESITKSAASADAMIKDLQATALGRGLDFAVLDDGVKRLVNMGVALSNAKALYLDVTNAAQGMGLGAAGIERITMALGQMVSKGTVSAEEMTQQLGELIPAWKILADHIHKTVQETQKMAQAGQIAPQVMLDAIQEWSKANFGDAPAKFAQSWDGALARIKASFDMFAATAGAPLFRAIEAMTVAVANFVQSADATRWANQLAEGVATVIDAVSRLLPPLGNVRGFLDDLFDSVSRINPEFVKMAARFLAFAGTATALAAGLAGIALVVGLIANPIGLLIIGVAALGAAWVTNFAGIQEAVAGVVTTVQDVAQTVGAFLASAQVAQWAQGLSTGLNTVVNALSAMISPLLALLPSFAQMRDTAASLIPTLQQVGVFLDGVFDAISRINPVVIQAVAGFLAGAASVLALAAAASAAWGILVTLGGALAVLASPLALVAIAVGLLVAAWVTDFMGIQETTASVIATVTPLLQSLQTIFETVFPVLLEIALTIFSTIAYVIQSNLETIATIVQAVLGFIEDVWAKHGDTVLQVVDVLWTLVQNTIGNAMEAASAVIGIAMNVIQGNWQEAWRGVLQLVQLAWENIVNIVNAGAQAVVKVMRIIGGATGMPFLEPDGIGSTESGLNSLAASAKSAMSTFLGLNATTAWVEAGYIDLSSTVNGLSTATDGATSSNYKFMKSGVDMVNGVGKMRSRIKDLLKTLTSGKGLNLSGLLNPSDGGSFAEIQARGRPKEPFNVAAILATIPAQVQTFINNIFKDLKIPSLTLPLDESGDFARLQAQGRERPPPVFPAGSPAGAGVPSGGGGAGGAAKKAGEDAKASAGQIRDWATALAASHPAAIAAAAEVKYWGDMVTQATAALDANKAAIKDAESTLKGMQENLKGLQKELQGMQDHLSELQGQLDDLNNTKVAGSSAMDSEQHAIDQQEKRIKLARMLHVPLQQIIDQYPLLDKGAEDFVGGLSTNLRKLDKEAQKLELAKSLGIDEQTRAVDQVRNPVAELPYQDIITQTQAKAAAITALNVEIQGQNDRIAAVNSQIEAQQALIETLHEQQDILSASLQTYQAKLQQAEEMQKNLNAALIEAYTWFLKDRAELEKLGPAGVLAASQIDAATVALLTNLDATTLATTGSLTETINGLVQSWHDAVDAINAEIARIHTAAAQVHITTTTTSTPPPEPQADGGPTRANVPYFVGERGRELFVPQVPGRIISAHETHQMLREVADTRTSAQNPIYQARAMGGPVSSGTTYTVGERGRELFVPQVPGDIISSHVAETIFHNAQTTTATSTAITGSKVVQTWNDTMNRLTSERDRVIPGPDTSGIPRHVDARVDGGPVFAGSPYLVGERGQELFMPDWPGQIIPAHETATLLARLRASLTGGDRLGDARGQWPESPTLPSFPTLPPIPEGPWPTPSIPAPLSLPSPVTDNLLGSLKNQPWETLVDQETAFGPGGWAWPREPIKPPPSLAEQLAKQIQPVDPIAQLTRALPRAMPQTPSYTIPWQENFEKGQVDMEARLSDTVRQNTDEFHGHLTIYTPTPAPLEQEYAALRARMRR